MLELFSDVVRMPFPGGVQTVDWAVAFEEAGRPDLAREIFDNALTALRKRQSQQPELLKASIQFLIRHRDFETAESTLVKDSWIVNGDAAQLIFTLYRDWDRLEALDSELPKFFLPGGVEKEIRFLAGQHLAGKAPVGDSTGR
jgi:hypothetical protein